MGSYNQTILIVEDEADLQDIYSDYVVSLGFMTQTCSKVSEAMNRLRNQAFAAVILDMALEQGSGDRIVHSLRDDKKSLNHKTPILVVSATLDRGILSAIVTGVQGVLVKPVDEEQFQNKLKELVKIP